MSETNLFFHAITEALNAHIERAVETRLTALQQSYANAIGELAKRVEALENNPAIGTDTVLEARVKVLEERPVGAIDTAQVVVALSHAETFWEKLDQRIAAATEEAIDDHLSSYNHDEYDEMYNEWGGESVSEFVKDDDIESQINDALRNASFEVRVTL